jgi:hypothetical protein
MVWIKPVATSTKRAIRAGSKPAGGAVTWAPVVGASSATRLTLYVLFCVSLPLGLQASSQLSRALNIKQRQRRSSPRPCKTSACPPDAHLAVAPKLTGNYQDHQCFMILLTVQPPVGRCCKNNGRAGQADALYAVRISALRCPHCRLFGSHIQPNRNLIWGRGMGGRVPCYLPQVR